MDSIIGILYADDEFQTPNSCPPASAQYTLVMLVIQVKFR
jgi:hypothetical protein